SAFSNLSFFISSGRRLTIFSRDCSSVLCSSDLFADSSLLNLLLEAQARYTAAGRRLAVAGPFHDAVRRLFDITGTAAHLPLTENARTAVRQAAADTDPR